MTDTATMLSLADVYPTAHIRGRRISRLEERGLGWQILDANTADTMIRDDLGWFVGAHPGVERAAEQLGRLDANPLGGTWIVAPVGRRLAHQLYDFWPHKEHVEAAPEEGISVWRSRKVWFAMPEELKRILPDALAAENGVAGIIIVDPTCLIYQSRRGTDWRGRTHVNDRPQHIVNFRASLAAASWQPPLMVLTGKPVKSVATDEVARAFCLNRFHFIAGDSFACWEDPIE